MAHIVLGVTGSIAAYKACELVRILRKQDFDVSVVMTDAATKFVQPLTFQTLSGNDVSVGMFDEQYSWKPHHISLAEQADVFVIAPCTANVMAKLAFGIADDLLTCSALATRAPVLLAPAMNCNMLDHPATQHNLGVLLERNVTIASPTEGDLACGYEGRGRMAEPCDIFEQIASLIKR